MVSLAAPSCAQEDAHSHSNHRRDPQDQTQHQRGVRAASLLPCKKQQRYVTLIPMGWVLGAGGPPRTTLCLAHTCLRALGPQDVHAGGVEEVL